MSFDYEKRAKPLALRSLRRRLGWTQEQMAIMLFFTRRSLRRRLGWTQEQMAIMLFFTRTHYSKVERGLVPFLGNYAGRAEARLVMLDALSDIVGAAKEAEIPNPNDSFEDAWRVTLNLSLEMREAA